MNLPPNVLSRIYPAPSGCWIWLGAISDKGYGRSRQRVYVHRLTYEASVGPIPDGLQIDHLCRVRRCCNPLHLEAVTPLVNNRRGNTRAALRARGRKRTHCAQGHEFTPENTMWTSSRGKPYRACRACNRKHCLDYQRRRRQERAA